MNTLSMTASPTGMDPQQIPGITNPGASYVQITRNSTSLWKLETWYQINQQAANPCESKDCKCNLLIYGVEEHDPGTKWIQQSLNDVVSVSSNLSSVDDNFNNHSLISEVLASFTATKDPVLSWQDWPDL